MSAGAKQDRFFAAMREIYGIVPPLKPKVIRAGDLELRWAGPGQWLALAQSQNLSDRLTTQMQDIATAVDLSDARAVLAISGPKVRETLAKGCAIDLHARAFRVGDVALTSIAQMSVHIVQIGDAPVFELSVARSMAGSFWRWLAASAEEFGYGVEDAG